MMLPLVLFETIDRHPLWRALERLHRALAAADADPTAAANQASSDSAAAAAAAAAVATAYADALRALLASDRAHDATVLAEALLQDENALARGGGRPAGVAAAARADLARLASWARRDWRSESEDHAASSLPPLTELAAPRCTTPWEEAVAELRSALLQAEPEALLEIVARRYREAGTGVAARYLALAWSDGELRGIERPALTDTAGLIGLEEPLRRLFANTEAFLARRPAHNTLLYGPRGSGKSSAIRGLLTPYGASGLRLVEVSGEDLHQLPRVLERLRDRPQRFVLFVDDLSFEADDGRYHPLKTLLEGSLTSRPENVVLYATSNRRHIVKEHFSDRPDPLNDDVHSWDSHNEKLALADRFGLVLTFPDATQRRYLEIVMDLAQRTGLPVDGLVPRAIRFADWGNGYSGRTAQQFIDALLQEQSG